jgi:hypothetical protein
LSGNGGAGGLLPQQQQQQQPASRHRLSPIEGRSPTRGESAPSADSPTQMLRELARSSGSPSSPPPEAVDAAVVAARQRLRRAESEHRAAEQQVLVAERRAAAAAFVASQQRAEALLDGPLRVLQTFIRARRAVRVVRILRAIARRKRIETDEVTPRRPPPRLDDDDSDDDDGDSLDGIGLIESEITDSARDLSAANSSNTLRGGRHHHRQSQSSSHHSLDRHDQATPPKYDDEEDDGGADPISAAETSRSPRPLLQTQSQLQLKCGSSVVASPADGALAAADMGGDPALDEARFDEAALHVMSVMESAILERLREAYADEYGQ